MAWHAISCRHMCLKHLARGLAPLPEAQPAVRTAGPFKCKTAQVQFWLRLMTQPVLCNARHCSVRCCIWYAYGAPAVDLL